MESALHLQQYKNSPEQDFPATRSVPYYMSLCPLIITGRQENVNVYSFWETDAIQ